MTPRVDTVLIEEERCTGCGWCVAICPMDVLRQAYGLGKAVVAYPDDCTRCFTCVVECEAGAVELTPHISLKAPPSIYDTDIRALGLLR